MDRVQFPITVVPIPPPPTPHPCRKHWERFAPRSYVVASTTTREPMSLIIDVECCTTDEGKSFRTWALIDSGATGSFIDQDYAARLGLTRKRLSRAIPVYNVDGTRNESGCILEVVDVVLNYKGHGERTLLAVTSLGKQSIILGYTWLRQHNPEIDWRTQEIKLTRCPKQCDECHREMRTESSCCLDFSVRISR